MVGPTHGDKECLFNDQIDPSPMAIVKEECLDDEDNHNCTDISSSYQVVREENNEEDE